MLARPADEEKKNQWRKCQVLFGSPLPCVSLLVSERAQDYCNGERWSGGDLERWGKVETHGFK